MQNTLILSALFACVAVSATSGPYDHLAEVDVLPGWKTSDGTHMTGFRITLAPGWKTYWRAPGDAGIPPQFGWAGSENIASAQFHWPVPNVFDQSGMRSIGYHDSVVIPVELTPAVAGAPIQITGQIDIGVCEDICVPVSLQFSADLPLTGSRDSAIVAALVDRPMTQQEAGAGAVTCTIAPIDGGMQITTSLTLPRTGQSEAVVIEAGNPMVWVSEPDVSRVGNQLTATADMIHATGDAFALNRSAVRITVLGSDRAVDIQGCSAG